MEHYIKMVRTLPDEFFEGWEWSVGDRAITLTSHIEVMSVSSLFVMKNPEWLEVIHPYSDDNTHDLFKVKELRPIPSQRQLQDMLKSNPDKFKEKFPRFPIISIHDGWLWMAFDDYIEFRSPSIHNIIFEEFWLMLVMFVLYEKEWNGEAWV